jgi:2-oxoglutarate ferredoxin oxidoreductase subunit alpha
MTLNVQPGPNVAPEMKSFPLVNDFSIVAATVNGSGSQTANQTLIRALFKMGIPVNGKNLFPSNISGLPTWYTIRVNKDGYIARRDVNEILVAMNTATQAEDIKTLPPGGLCLYPQEWKIRETREDITFYSMPVAAIAKASGADASLRDYVANMVYVGALAELIGIDMAEIENALKYHFKGKAKPIALNLGVVQEGAKHIRENYAASDKYRVERMNATSGKFLVEGNTAAGLGSIFGGAEVVAWYPITPSTSMVDSMRDYLDLRVDKATGKTTLAILQAEDELSAIGTVIGAGWAGARALTSTSGPGISLMSEFAGLSFFAEIPAVIWDIQRMGPSTGLPTRVSQGDVLSAYFLSHGDTRHIVLFPSNMQECFDFGIAALDLAEQFQTLVLVLSDLDLGMNLWMTEPFNYPEKPLNRGKVLNAEDLERLGGFARYRDVDGDGIAYRTLPGTDHPLAAYFTRGTGHTDKATYSERPDDWEKNLDRLFRKHNTARKFVPAPVVENVTNAAFGIISYGTNDPGVVEARAQLAAKGVNSSYLRVRALPFADSVQEFIEAHNHVYVVENNFDGQMAMLLRMEYPELATKIYSVAKCDGLPLTARWISSTILEQEG